jgi:hypothetical protein
MPKSESSQTLVATLGCLPLRESCVYVGVWPGLCRALEEVADPSPVRGHRHFPRCPHLSLLSSWLTIPTLRTQCLCPLFPSLSFSGMALTHFSVSPRTEICVQVVCPALCEQH